MTRAELYQLPNVVGSGIGAPSRDGTRLWGREALVVYVSRKVPAADLAPEERIPNSIDGFETDVVETGAWRAREEDPYQSIMDRYFWDPYALPLRYGCPIGHISGTTGRACAVVRGRNTGLSYVLGTNHVLAATTGGPVVGAARGDKILFPDVATIESAAWELVDDRMLYRPCTVAHLAEWVPLLDETQPMPVPYSPYHEVLPDGRLANLLDAAIARPIADDLLMPDPRLQSRDGQTLAPRTAASLGDVPTQFAVPQAGMEVWHPAYLPRPGRITEIDAEIGYEIGGRTYLFRHQIVTDIPSNPGDSGAPLIHGTGYPMYLVGMLIAGSDDYSAYNPAITIRNAFNLVLPS